MRQFALKYNSLGQNAIFSANAWSKLNICAPINTVYFKN